MQPIKISMIEPVGGHGGVEFYDIGLCKAINNQGLRVTLYTSDKTTLDQNFNVEIDIKKFYKGIYGKDNKIIRGIRYIKGTLKSLIDAKKNNSSIAHFHIYNFSTLEYLNLLLFKKNGFKIVATIHDIEKLSDLNLDNSKKTYKKFADLMDTIIVHTNFSKKELEQNLDTKNKQKIKIVPHGDTDFLFNKDIPRNEARKKLNLNLPENSKIILFFGQIKKVKGLEILINAFSIVNKEIPNSYLLIAGKVWKTTFEEYDQIIENLNIDKSKVIKHIRFIENKMVPLYFKASDIVVLPYKKVYNSGVVLRAMDYGSSIIASDLDPFKEVIKDGYNGLLFKSGDHKELSEKILTLIRNEDLRNDLRKNARKTINEKYSWQEIGKIMKDIYLNTLNIK